MSKFIKERIFLRLTTIYIILVFSITPEILFSDMTNEIQFEAQPDETIVENPNLANELSFTDTILLKVRGSQKEEENVVYCPVCGHTNGLNTRKCVYCGALLLREDNEGNLFRYCIYCGHNNPPYNKECNNCHYSFSKPRNLATLSELIWRKGYALSQDNIISQRRIMTISPITISCGVALLMAINSKVNEPATGMLKFIGMSAITIGIMQFISSNFEYRFWKKNLEELREAGKLSGYIKY
ncbi:MAG: hypothetical protein ACUVWP_09280 [bacterium]